MVNHEPTDHFEDPLLQREAGEGWHDQGLNRLLLGALVLRETIYDEIIVTREMKGTVPDSLFIELERQMSVIQRLKVEYKVGDPPPVADRVAK